MAGNAYVWLISTDSRLENTTNDALTKELPTYTMN